MRLLGAFGNTIRGLFLRFRSAGCADLIVD
jgi:hypothetical protein